MTDGRKDIRVDADTKQLAAASKRDGETWDGWTRRAVDALQADAADDQYPAPRCTDCGSRAHAWTVENGDLRCPNCADGPVDALDDA